MLVATAILLTAGCHNEDERLARFASEAVQRQAEQNQTAALSAFMTGVNVNDPVTGARRRFNEFARRSADLRRLICRPQTAPTEGALERVH